MHYFSGSCPCGTSSSETAMPNRQELASRYLEELPFAPYPLQEEALDAWFRSDQGIMVCATTGTGKTLIAEGALFEALHSGKKAYYTTPLIALTEQKFREMQDAAVRWGFRAEDVGLVTGNRRVNPHAQILVVVAEILLNRLLNPTDFGFEDVEVVVKDEFHTFSDPERGIVWELSLALLPNHVRLLLLSATVGNPSEFIQWLDRSHGRRLGLVESTERKVPLTYHWVKDKFLGEQLSAMVEGDERARRTPALVFCFNRRQCWSVAEQLKGLRLLKPAQRLKLSGKLDRMDWTQGAGPRLKQVLQRGVGVHHAGILPKYRRVVEELFQQRLLSAAICTETLSAGINLPARSIVLTTLVKGPPGQERLVEPSTAHQIFGRAGRPQYDSRGFVFALAHPDDVRILRWKVRHQGIARNQRGPRRRRTSRTFDKRIPRRRKTRQYYDESHFVKLQRAHPGPLSSRGPLPWRLLVYLLSLSPEVERVRSFIRKRFLGPRRREAAREDLTRMILTLWKGGYLNLEPQPPETEDALQPQKPGTEPYQPVLASPTDELPRLRLFRSINPLYGAFLVEQLGQADRRERLQAMESVLNLPWSVGRLLPVPSEELLVPGRLANSHLDDKLIQHGLLPPRDPKSDEEGPTFHPPPFADKLRMLFELELPRVTQLWTDPIWAAGELFAFRGDFNQYVTQRNLVKEEGILFRHFLRLILLCGEFARLDPPKASVDEWRQDLNDIADRLTQSCREVDPASTDRFIEKVAPVRAPV